MKNTGNSRKIRALLLTAVLLLSVVGCGGKDSKVSSGQSVSTAGSAASAEASSPAVTEEAEDALGKYTCRQVLSGGLDAGASGEYVELEKGGKAVIQLTGTPYDATYKRDGENITVTVQGDDNTGTLKGDVLTLSIMSMDYIFVKEGRDYTPDPSTIIGYTGDTAAEDAAVSEDTDSADSAEAASKGSVSGKGAKSSAEGSTDAGEEYTPDEIWHGRWIGCMYMDDAAGSYSNYEGKYITAVANIDEEDGKDYLDVYLPNNGYSEDDNTAFLSMYIDLFDDHFMIDDQEGWVTNMTITSEYFPDYYVIFLPDHGNLITFSSTYADPEDPSGHFRFTLELRPNGSVFDDSYDNFPSELPDAYKSYADYLESDKCTKNVIDGLTGAIVIDRGSPVYCPGVSKAEAAGSAGAASEDADKTTADTGSDDTASEGEGGDSITTEYDYMVDGRLTSRDGYFSLVVPKGWEYMGDSSDSNYIYLYTDDGNEQIDIKLDYLNGYTLKDRAHEETYSTDTYDYDKSIKEGTAKIDGRTFYTVGPSVSYGTTFYHLFSEWKPDPTMFINIAVRLNGQDDKAKMEKVLKSADYKSIISSIRIKDK